METQPSFSPHTLLIQAGFGAVVYRGDRDDVVIFQTDDHQEKHWIHLNPREARLVGAALLKIAEEIEPRTGGKACRGNP